MKRKIKILGLFLLSYSILITITIGLRLLHHLPIDIRYYVIISSVVITLFTFLNFTKGSYIEKILPKDSTFTFILVLARRFLPLAIMKIACIKDNQQMRGAKFSGISQFKNYISLMVPGIVVAMKWSDRLSESITMRAMGKNDFKLQKN